MLYIKRFICILLNWIEFYKIYNDEGISGITSLPLVSCLLPLFSPPLRVLFCIRFSAFCYLPFLFIYLFQNNIFYNIYYFITQINAYSSSNISLFPSIIFFSFSSFDLIPQFSNSIDFSPKIIPSFFRFSIPSITEYWRSTVCEKEGIVSSPLW